MEWPNFKETITFLQNQETEKALKKQKTKKQNWIATANNL